MNVKTFKYLGMIFTPLNGNLPDEELGHKIAMAQAKMGELKKVFKNRYIDMKAKRKFFNAYIESRLCYAANTWAATKRQLDRLQSAQVKLLRKMVRNGTKRTEGYSLVYTNKDIFRITRSTPLCEYVQNQQCKWYAHCVRSDNDRFTKTLFYENEKGRAQTLKKQVQDSMGYDELQLIQMSLDREF